MNSCLYECAVMHHRLEPLKNRFVYRMFMFYLDLDELDSLAGTLRLLSRNQFNVFNFRDDDHLQFSGTHVKESIIEYLDSKGVALKNGRVMLLTHLCTLGYTFNPVSFYFCFDENGQPLCVVPEIGNTFGELKLFFIGQNELDDGSFCQRTEKYFYVSPFTDLDTTFDFNLKTPGETLNLRIDDYQEGQKFFISTLTGSRKELTDGRLCWYTLRFPFITLKVIFLIHWQALKLILRKLPYHKKTDHPELQREVYYGRNA